MEGYLFLLEISLIILGFAVIAFTHLVIPFCFSRPRKIWSTAAMWWIAALGGLLGHVMCCAMSESFNNFGGFLISVLCVVAGFAIMHHRKSKFIIEELMRINEENNRRKRRFWFWIK